MTMTVMPQGVAIMAIPQAMCVTHIAEGVRVTRIPSALTRAQIEAEIERLIALLRRADLVAHDESSTRPN